MEHRQAILESLGINHNRDRMVAIDARAWSWFKRERTFFGSLPAPLTRWKVPMREAPWDQGWEVRTGAGKDYKLPTMMRSRDDHRGGICISTH
eukprot:9121503-Heterocapsa_arctica.AAC.1